GETWDETTAEPWFLRTWAAGAAGERRAAEGFAAALPAHPGVVVLHDRRWPGRPRANVDHVLVGPGGVAVVDTKAWAGLPVIRDGTLWVNGRRRPEAIRGVLEQVAAVRAVLVDEDLAAVPLQGAVHWVHGEHVPLDGRLRSEGVPLLDAATTVALVATGPLTADEVRRVALVLERRLPPAA
ncbi:nuclease-related domain-containing protein, partial [Patulibacter sp. S7RM1-6]